MFVVGYHLGMSVAVCCCQEVGRVPARATVMVMIQGDVKRLSHRAGSRQGPHGDYQQGSVSLAQ